MASIDSAWIDGRYKVGEMPEDGSAPPLLCRRCGAEVDWLTKHAVERHRDMYVKVIDPTRPEPAGGWKW